MTMEEFNNKLIDFCAGIMVGTLVTCIIIFGGYV